MDIFLDTLRNGEYWFFLIILALSVAAQLPKIIDIYNVNRKRRIKDLTEAFTDPNISVKLRDHLKDEIDVEYFRLAHKVQVSKIMLDAILILKERVAGRVSFRHIVRVASLVPDITEINKESYTIKLNYFDKIFSIYNLVFGIILFTLGFFLIWATIITGNFENNLNLLLPALMFLPAGVYMFNQGASLVSVWHINKALIKFAEKSL